jgi:hypothetical protein
MLFNLAPTDNGDGVREIPVKVWQVQGDQIVTATESGEATSDVKSVHVVLSVQPEEKTSNRPAVYQERRSGRIPTRKRNVPFKFRYAALQQDSE